MIGLLHANVGGNQDHDSYAPCTVSDLTNTGFDYWALGHVHTRQTLQETGPAIVYPGNPQGRHPNEPGARGVYLVEVDDHGGVQLDFQPTDVVRWETLSLDIGFLETEQDLINAVNDLAEDALTEAQGRSVVARVEFAGRGGVAPVAPLPRARQRISGSSSMTFMPAGALGSGARGSG